MNDQKIKADHGKIRPTLVPPESVIASAMVREYGMKKYGEAESWRSVSVERYDDALLRHTLEYWKNRNSIDEESGLPALFHMACNIDFLIALRWEELLSEMAEKGVDDYGAEKNTNGARRKLSGLRLLPWRRARGKKESKR